MYINRLLILLKDENIKILFNENNNLIFLFFIFHRFWLLYMRKNGKQHWGLWLRITRATMG